MLASPVGFAPSEWTALSLQALVEYPVTYISWSTGAGVLMASGANTTLTKLSTDRPSPVHFEGRICGKGTLSSVVTSIPLDWKKNQVIPRTADTRQVSRQRSIALPQRASLHFEMLDEAVDLLWLIDKNPARSLTTSSAVPWPTHQLQHQTPSEQEAPAQVRLLQRSPSEAACWSAPRRSRPKC